MHFQPPPLFDSIIYPDSDGLPMADNTKQAKWIIVLFGNLSALFRERPDVFVATNLLWYAEEGHPEVRAAPDVFIAFGRPKGDRGSYKQWEEGDTPPTVVFEILSPGNTAEEMIQKHLFYDEHGVEEYYIYDPDHKSLFGYVRKVETLAGVWKMNGFVSPRLGIRFDVSGEELIVYGPDGQRFLTFEELHADRDRERQQRLTAQQRAARLAELSRKARRQQASPEELQELERLEGESSSSS
jgi:Uma2 family endonuclease